MNPIKIQLLLDGASQVSQALSKLVNDAQQAFGKVSQAGKGSTAGVGAAEQAIAALTKRIDLSNRAFERLRQSGRLTAEQLAKMDALRTERNTPRVQERSALQVADARQTLGVKPFADVGAEVAKTRQAYATLAASGKLTHAELLQASLRQQQAVAELRAQTNGWAQSLATVKGQFAALAGVAVGFTLAAREAIAFESAMADVRKVVDATPEGFAQITRSIRDLSAELPVTAVGLAQMAEAGGQLGIAGDRIPEFVRLASEMSVAFKMTAEESGNAVGKLGNIFGLQLPQVRALADSVNALGDSSAATERDIVNVLQRTGGLGRQFGLTAQQASGLATAFLSLGDPPEIAATAINNLLGKLQAAPAQSADFQRTLKALGIDARQLASDIEGDAAGALRGFLATLEKLDAKSRSQALSMMFGTGGDTASIAKLVGELGKLDTALQTATGAAAQGGLSKALKLQADTAASQMQIMRNGLADIGIALGAAMLPVIKAVSQAVAALARMASAVADVAPWVLQSAAVMGVAAAASGALRMAMTVASLAAARMGLSLGAAAAGTAAAGAASAAAAPGVALLGGAFRVLLGPIGLAVLAIEGLILVWNKWQAAKDEDAARTPAQLQADLDRIRAERARREQAARDTGQFGVEQQARLNTLKRQEAEIEGRLTQQRLESEDALRAGAGPRGGSGEGYDSGEDITDKLRDATEQAQAAAKARLGADREAAAARAALAADANARALAELQRALDREAVTLDTYYAEKRRRAEADADAQIRLKERERAALAASQPESAADQETQKGQLAKLAAEIEQLQRNRNRIGLDLAREQADALLKLSEESSRERLAAEQRGADAALSAARTARALGLASAADLAADEARMAEQRVQAEVDAAQRILAARRLANAPAAAIREAQAGVEAAQGRQRDQRREQVAAVGERVRALREQAADIRLQLDADPARRAVAEASRDLVKLREQADADRAVLQVQLQVETDPEAQERIRALLATLNEATADAVVARNDRLTEDLKPGWQKMVEGWRDAQRLMRDAADETMDRLVRGGEDAFAELAKTGKLNVKSLFQDLQAQAGRTLWRQLVGSEQGQKATSWLSGLLKPAAAKEGEPGFMGPPQPQAGGAAEAADPVRDLAQAAADAADALRGIAAGGAPGARGAAGAGPLAGLSALSVKGYSGQEGDASFMGPLPEAADASAAAMDKSAAAADKLATAADNASAASSMQAAATAASALGLGELSQVVSLASMAMALMEMATKAAAAMKLATMGSAVGHVFTGAQRFAAGGSFGAFTNKIVSSPTLFRFAHGGRMRLGEMGEAGPEAIMPLEGGHKVTALDATGRRVGALRLARGAGGRLSVVLAGANQAAQAVGRYAAGGLFGAALQAPALRFAAGGAFAGASALSAGAARMAPAVAAGVGGGITLNMVANVPAGASRNEVLQAMQQARRDAVAEVESRMRRNRNDYNRG